MTANLPVYLEIGTKKTFAGALNWPGLCRSGRDEAAALQALLDYAPRYVKVLGKTIPGFQSPTESGNMHVIETLKGDATTDFGAPGAVPSADEQPMDDTELLRSKKLLQACWQSLDSAVEKAKGKRLTTGPRGGGRDLQGLIRHVTESAGGYLASIGWKPQHIPVINNQNKMEQFRLDLLDGLTAAAHGELPTVGPRGGIRWKPRYFVRRLAWHVLDHAWELEDRSGG